MNKIRHILSIALWTTLALALSGCKFALLNPKGTIAADEKHIMILTTLLMLIVIIPVILLILFVAWKYREGNSQATYAPEWTHSVTLEIVWWSIPCVIVAILATITWNSSHRLDPYKALTSQTQPLVIQAIALQWKWLFIYPEQNIATVDFIEIPIDRPITFLITAEGPMNSFQIPQLAGQIYAMAGMQTKLHLIANEPGDYRGISSNFSGNGFSDMKFIARARTSDQFEQWVKEIKISSQPLTIQGYDQLLKPSENNPVTLFSAAPPDLFAAIIMKTMLPASGATNLCNPETNEQVN